MTSEMKPWMSEAELTLFSSAIDGKQCAVEYGVGGSTVCLANAGISRIVSVDSDLVWVRKLAEHELLEPYVSSGTLTIHHADIGPTIEWGHPRDVSKITEWPNYWREPWRWIDSEIVDLVYIDGRFRVACALNSILQGNRNMTMVIHDFWSRSHYHLLLKHLNSACRADTLGVFFVRASVDLRDVAMDLTRYALVPD
jgi:hypothetical protein